jgi:hypothetical protein
MNPQKINQVKKRLHKKYHELMIISGNAIMEDPGSESLLIPTI